MLNKSHRLSRYKANSGKNKKEYLMDFDPDARVFVLSYWHKMKLFDKFSSVLLTAQKSKFSINDFFSKYDQICINSDSKVAGLQVHATTPGLNDKYKLRYQLPYIHLGINWYT